MLHCFILSARIHTQRGGREGRKNDSKAGPAAKNRMPASHMALPHHRPTCAPSSTCSTCPVTCAACQIDHSRRDILRLRKGAHRCARVLVARVQRRIDNARRDRVKANLSFAYSLARLSVIVSMPPFVIIGTDAGTPVTGLSASAALMVVTLPPLPWASICRTAACVIKTNPSRLIVRTAEVVGGVLRKGLREIDARVVYQMVDRAELLDRHCHVLRRRWLANVSIHQREGRGRQARFGQVPRGRYQVIAAARNA